MYGKETTVGLAGYTMADQWSMLQTVFNRKAISFLIHVRGRGLPPINLLLMLFVFDPELIPPAVGLLGFFRKTFQRFS